MKNFKKKFTTFSILTLSIYQCFGQQIEVTVHNNFDTALLAEIVDLNNKSAQSINLGLINKGGKKTALLPLNNACKNYLYVWNNTNATTYEQCALLSKHQPCQLVGYSLKYPGNDQEVCNSKIDVEFYARKDGLLLIRSSSSN